MCSRILRVAAFWLVLTPVLCEATTVDFYTDGTIEEGAAFDYVNVWDAAAVDMSGGFVDQLTLNESSTFNLYDGEISVAHLLDASTMTIYGGEIVTDVGVFGNAVANLYGGIYSYYVAASESGSIHIFGYDFELTQSGSSYFLSGFWADGTAFTDIYLRGPDTYPRVTLHVIPEPSAMFLLLAGFGLMRKTRR